MRWITVFLISVILAACGALPAQGPSSAAITSEKVASDAALANYTLIGLDDQAISVLRHYKPQSFANRFGAVPVAGRGTRLGVGDAIHIHIWEAAPDGLFSTERSKQSGIETVIDEAGFIFIPYAGRIRAAGLSVEGLRTTVQNKLIGKAIEPQVLITVLSNQSNSAVVVGDVVKPGRYPISIRGSKLLELVAEAGGAREASYETVVTLKRGSRSGTARFEDLIENPQNNIWVSSGDNILLSHRPRSFSVFGAVTKEQLVPFRTQEVTLAEALAYVGGIRDFTADPAGIFLFRFEEAGLVRQMAPGRFDAHVSAYTLVPVVYRLNLRNADGFLRARFVQMKDKDILYVANHPTAEFGKFLQIISPLISNVSTVNRLEFF
ncbi:MULTISPECIES: polysaccharide biosynthesis/export family protein [Pseudovibrio]|uniref:polysaccharide biosynthesis/export family protein n=1 Tax=Stappiaceae TaxID=2821832 RepID=UPI0023669195|nr:MULTISPECIES: polysaccharide biosynthesis/export family protein [Pseudovibrio]MDD7909038.1 polysaccharide export protein [Pseudovibrio exalbescens]MDX5593641.1 polysaccharide biosynthesis/export family protein [Pseudovibrio sp. SPO723]